MQQAENFQSLIISEMIFSYVLEMKVLPSIMIIGTLKMILIFMIGIMTRWNHFFKRFSWQNWALIPLTMT